MASADSSKKRSDGFSTTACAVAGAAVFGAAALGHVANGLVNDALVCTDPAKTEDITQSIGRNLSPAAAASFKVSHERSQELLGRLQAEWLPNVEVERIIMPSADGRLNVAGFVYPAKEPGNRWVMLAHGYRGEHREMECYGAYYARRGFNVFAPDLAAHGESEGTYLGMGGPERFDLLLWADYLIDRFGADIQIVLHGHSTGAATVLMASGEGLPPQVKAVISDSSYSSVWSLFSEILVQQRIPPRPLLDAARLIMKIRSGYDFKDVNVARKVAQSMTPTLFIHGGADLFISPTMSVDLYACCAARIKELHVVPGAGHAESFALDPDAYFALVDHHLEAAGMALS